MTSIENNNKYRKLYCFWTGTNSMSTNRKRCFETLVNTGLEVILITPYNLNNYIKEPLHPGYKYLSNTHKADYLRTYFMHFYGGGYSDIKEINRSWLDAVKLIENNDNIWIIGYKESGPRDVAIVDDPKINKVIHDEWFKLLGNGCYICKPNTPFTTLWYNSMIEVMDKIYDDLQKYPARHPREGHPMQSNNNYKYPLKWTELLGSIFHPICHKYHKHISQTLPKYKRSPYR